jgi:uncharacterized protein (DUF1501 family)
MENQEMTPPATEEREARLSRRRLLGFGVALGLGALAVLTACGEEEDDDDDDD